MYFALGDLGTQDQQNRRNNAAFKLLAQGVAKLRKAVDSIFSQFLSSRLMMARLEGHASVKTVQDLIATCSPRLGVPNPEVCGKIVTSQVDPDAFVVEALFAVHAPMAAAADDIAVLADANLGEVFALWRGTWKRLSKRDVVIAEKASDAGRQLPVLILRNTSRTLFQA